MFLHFATGGDYLFAPLAVVINVLLELVVPVIFIVLIMRAFDDAMSDWRRAGDFLRAVARMVFFSGLVIAVYCNASFLPGRPVDVGDFRSIEIVDGVALYLVAASIGLAVASLFVSNKKVSKKKKTTPKTS